MGFVTPLVGRALELAGPVSIAGTVPVEGTVGVSGTVPVEGTVGIGNGSTVGVNGLVNVTGTVSTLGAVDYRVDDTNALLDPSKTYTFTALQCYQTIAVQVTCTWVGNALVILQNLTNPTLNFSGSIPCKNAFEALFPFACDVNDEIQLTIYTQASLADATVRVQGLTGTYVQQVSNANGSPLEVVTYGGLQRAGATIASGVTATFLAAPQPGTVYRLHRFVGSQAAWLQGASSQNLYSILTTANPSDSLDGQLANEGISVVNESANGGYFFLFYDIVNLPTIQ